MSVSTRDRLCLDAASGNADARKFLATVLQIAHAWDDLIDKDKVLSDEVINTTFQNALIALPCNPFYAKFRHLLEPVLLMSLINWRAATNVERQGGRVWTFILRSSYVDLLVLTKMITAGMDQSVAFAAVVREETHNEGVDGYLAALTLERSKET